MPARSHAFARTETARMSEITEKSNEIKGAGLGWGENSAVVCVFTTPRPKCDKRAPFFYCNRRRLRAMAASPQILLAHPLVSVRE